MLNVLLSLLNCVLKTCSRANVSCVLTSQRALNTYVLSGKTWEKSYIGIEFIPILVLLFLFSPVLIQPH